MLETTAEVNADLVEGMVAGAELPPLLVALAHATGDRSFLDPGLAPPLGQRGASMTRHGGMDSEAVAKASALAQKALLDGVSVEPGVQEDLMQQSMSFLAGRLLGGAEELLRHEILGSTQEASLNGAGLRAIIIGTGISGIAAAVNLQAAGVKVTMLEKNDEIGGTWWENTYPGCRLDTPNFTYSFSFAQREVWPDHYTLQPDVLDYLLDVVDKFNLRRSMRFNTEVTNATWDDDTTGWRVQASTPDGPLEVQADVLITAVGQLNRPKIPNIEGLHTFPGKTLHSAEWDPSVEMTGRRVAVVGTGASAFQIVPTIADQVDKLTVFQRNAPWMLPTPNYTQPIEGAQRALFDQIPGYGRWYRFWQFVLSMEAWLPVVTVDPDWNEPGSVSAANEAFRQEMITALEKQFSDRPDLLELCTPTYPPGTKRMLRDDGQWGRALRMEHVDVISSEIVRVDGSRLIAANGQEIDADVIIFATGFRAEEFLAPMEIVGRNGQSLSEYWDGDARSYATTTVPGFPNMFMMLGPNSGLAANGSIMFMSECAAEYIVSCLEVMQDKGADAMEPTLGALEQFSLHIDNANRALAWGVPGASTWYQNRFGRVSQNWPLGLDDYWTLTHEVDPSSYSFQQRTR